jgi:hypothetical protein
MRVDLLGLFPRDELAKYLTGPELSALPEEAPTGTAAPLAGSTSPSEEAP